MVDSAGQSVAAGPLLETKLYVPKWRPGLVSRPRLIERLDQGIERKLTLISAPAGFGKTTLLAEWLAATPASERPAAWVSLDQSDNDPALFWPYFIAALQTVQSGVGESALSLLHTPQPPPNRQEGKPRLRHERLELPAFERLAQLGQLLKHERVELRHNVDVELLGLLHHKDERLVPLPAQVDGGPESSGTNVGGAGFAATAPSSPV